jgi:chemotaxis regulatin CheY-phosphate phosphatase CheZ
MAESATSQRCPADALYDASNALLHAEKLLTIVWDFIQTEPIDNDHVLALVATAISYLHTQGVEAGETADDLLAQSM